MLSERLDERAGIEAVQSECDGTSVEVRYEALLLVGFAMVFLSYAFIHDSFVSRYSGSTPRSRRREAIFLLTYFLLPALGWIFLPLWVPALGCVACLVFLAFRWVHG